MVAKETTETGLLINTSASCMLLPFPLAWPLPLPLVRYKAWGVAATDGDIRAEAEAADGVSDTNEVAFVSASIESSC